MNRVPNDVLMKQLQEEIEELKKKNTTLTSICEKVKNIDIDITNSNLNDKIGGFIAGYGNDITNAPATSGYFINISHVWSSLRNTYNKQFFVPRTTNELYMRTQENGTWSNWTKI